MAKVTQIKIKRAKVKISGNTKRKKRKNGKTRA